MIDGVSVAKEMNSEDPFENMGAQLLKGSRDQKNQRTLRGDGTDNIHRGFAHANCE